MKKTGWLLFMYALPPRRGSQRVGLWRNLKKLGAISLKTSAYLLPDAPAHHERFQWLAKRVRDEGGDATLIRTDEIEGLSSQQIHTLFNQERGDDYAELIKDITSILGRKKSGQEEARAIALDKLRKRFVEIQQIDFFDSPKAEDARMLFKKAEGAQEKSAKIRKAKFSEFQQKTWLTRPRPEIDRVGSAWLIKTFIDPKAKFIFASQTKTHPGAVPYDMIDVEFTHHGDDCTFETLIRRFELSDKVLQKIARMIHDADLRDDKFAAIEAEGIDRVLKGLGQLEWSDQDILKHGFICFDALYATLRNA